MKEKQTSRAIARTRDYLSSLQNEKDGWFPYKQGGDPSTEASAWSMLALPDGPALQRAFTYICNQQNADGGWSTRAEAGRSDWTSALALLSLRLTAERAEQSGKKSSRQIKNALEYLFDSRYAFKPATRLIMLLSKGRSEPAKDRGWPWDPDCFHWIEPTSYSLLSLKLPAVPGSGNDSELQTAITKGNNFILDHACVGGGWNHGNDITLGSPLPPYRLTTAEALLALQDLPDDARVKSALDYLQTWSDKDSSALSLAMSALALMAYKRDASREISFLIKRQSERGTFSDQSAAVINTVSTALCALALMAHESGKSQLFIKERS